MPSSIRWPILDQIAAGSSDNLIRIIDIDNPSDVGVLKGHTGTVCELVVDGNELISGSFDTTVRIWKMDNNLVKSSKSGEAGGNVSKAGLAKKSTVQAKNSDAPISIAAESTASQFVAPRFNQPVARVSQKTQNKKNQPTTSGFQVPDPSSFKAGRSSFQAKSGKSSSRAAAPDHHKSTDNAKRVNFSNSGFQIAK